MGLQVRLRHALGERVLDLPERGVDRPLVVGRASDADVQVPSVHVGPRHLVLFVHEGRWVVQDAPGGTGTKINGAALRAARPVQGGDVMALGPEADAPTVEIEDALVAEGHSGNSQDATAAEAAAPAGAPPLPPAPVGTPASPAPGAAPVAASRLAPPVPDVVVETLGGNGQGAAAGAGAVMTEVPAPDWTPEAAAPARLARRRGRSRVGQLVAGLSIVLSVAIVTGAILFVYLRKQDQERQDRERAAIAAREQETREGERVAKLALQKEQHERERAEALARKRDALAAGKKTPVAPPPPPPDITDEMEAPNRRDVAVAPRVAPATAPATQRVTRTGDIPDPQFFGENVNDGSGGGEMSEEEREWKRIESVYYHPNIAKALLTFDGFAERFPNARKAQLEKYREDMLDKLWWSRIDSLIDKRKKLLAQVRDTQAKIKAETEEPFKKTVLEPQLETQKAELAAVTDRLRKDMMYNMDAAPPIGREPQMKALRDKRDRITYDQWKKATLKYIRDNHGAYPWANEG